MVFIPHELVRLVCNIVIRPKVLVVRLCEKYDVSVEYSNIRSWPAIIHIFKRFLHYIAYEIRIFSRKVDATI